MAVSAVRHQLRPVERFVAAPFLLLRLHPTLITVLTLVPAGLAAFEVSQRHWWPALAYGAAAALFDVADGTVARATGRVSRFGGFLDSVIDRVVDLLFLFGLGLAMDAPRAWVAVGAAVAGSFGTSYARARAYEYLHPPSNTWARGFERFERTLFIGLAVAAQAWADASAWRGPLLEACVWALALASLATFMGRVLTVRRLLSVNEEGQR